jgi:outer membrane protein assembly factor BamD
MRYLVNALASHEVHVARYYMKRGAYLAAANRAQYAIQHYAQAPALEEAVFVLVLAYDRLGMNDLRDAADRVMRTNFPDSKYLKAGGLRKDAPWWRLWDPDW